MIDIVIPTNNEEEFIAMAEKLGYTGLCFLYNLDEYLNIKREFQTKHKIKTSLGILANGRDINKVKIRLKGKKIFTAIKSSDIDRQIIEGSKADMVFSFEESTRKDFIHQRASGLNHILCKLARENNVIIGFSVNSILNAENKHIILGRITQNIQICKKFKVKNIIASFARNPFEMRSVHDLISLFEIIGLKNPSFLKEKDLK
jgi:RNase P/RNase MRP subunit p30